MAYPIWAYIFGLLLALPIFALVAVAGYMFVRLLIQWLSADGGATPGRSGKDVQG